MYGTGILSGLGVTFRHFVNTYIEDVKWGFRRHIPDEAFPARQGLETRGIFTVEYPDEKLAVPERFRFIPFLVVNNYDDPEQPGKDWCTSCGICAKVCPPQCIWIVRGTNPRDRAARAGAGGVLHRHRHLHELRLLRRVLPVRRDQDGSRLRAGQL